MRGLRVEFQADLDAHAVVLGRLLEEILLAQLAQRLQEVGRGGEAIEPLGELGAVALGDAGDQRFLAVEVDVERAGADARLLADVVHGGAVEAGAGKAALGRIEDVLAPRALHLRLELRHGRSHLSPAGCAPAGSTALAP